LVQPAWLLDLFSEWVSTSLLLLNGSAGVAPLLTVGSARWMANSLLLHEREIVQVTQIEMKALLDYNLTSILMLDTLLGTTCLFKVGVNGSTTCCIELQPWPPPEILHTNINSKLVETGSVASKLIVLARVVMTRAQPEIMCDGAKLLPTLWSLLSSRYLLITDAVVFLKQLPQEEFSYRNVNFVQATKGGGFNSGQPADIHG
jgi:hypothetical protein